MTLRLLFVLLLTLLGCLTKPLPVNAPTETCKVPARPHLVLDTQDCVTKEGQERVCMPVDMAVRLAEWMKADAEYHIAVSRCPLVEVVKVAAFSPTTLDPYKLAPLLQTMPASVAVTWRKCGQVNALYYVARAEVVMCNELKKLPDGVIRFIFAHELAHGVIYQNNVTYTGSEEWAADELAALVLIEMGDGLSVLEAAAWFKDKGTTEDHLTTSHPVAMRRFVTLGCMVLQSTGEDADICSVDYNRIKGAWARLLNGG